MPDSFVHLHQHSEYSMLDGASKIKEAVAAAVRDGQPALGVTDHGNMYGVPKFYKECIDQGIKPIIGYEAYMAKDTIEERPVSKKKNVDDSGDSGSEDKHKIYYHLTILAETDQGYRNLVKLASETFTREHAYYYKNRTDWDMIDQYKEGLILTSGCLGGQVLQALMRDDFNLAYRLAGRFQDMVGQENFFIELQDHGLPEQDATNPQLVKLSQKLRAPMLLTNDSHYVNRSDAFSHELLLCGQTGAKLKDKDRFKFHGEEHYIKSAAEMRGLFPDYPEASNNSLLIAERCDAKIEFGIAGLPHFEVPEEYSSSYEYLLDLCLEGAVERYGAPLKQEVLDRVAYELDTVSQMGYLDYFLITWDMIQYANHRGIRHGEGRGSAAGSLMAYCLGITGIDPLRYGLLFERFLNPERSGSPDVLNYLFGVVDVNDNSRHRRTLYDGYTTDQGLVSQWAIRRGDS